MGLFGIFGPTGSGKSTILDAITLALYGKVERAVNGTQGIMNHSEDSLTVSFTFELASSQGAHQYRVERRFKRMNELSISNTVSRFVEVLPDGENVLADKLVEVTKCVEDKIGLKMDDFTRAVVLPQGKFAEFLSLKGSERRQMLQRLFHLEQYGDHLAIKLSRRVKETDAALKAVEAEQQGLGNASHDAVQTAQADLKASITQAEEARKKLQLIQNKSEQLGKIREWQSEHERGEQKLQSLAARSDEIAAAEQKLVNSQAAHRLVPVLQQWQESHKQLIDHRAKADLLHNQAEEAERAAAQAALLDDQAQAVWSEEEPKLVLRQEQLEQAVLVQQEKDFLAKECKGLEQQGEQLSKDLKAQQEQLQREQELLDKGQKRQSELQQALRQLEVRASDREQLQGAMQLRHQLLLQQDQKQAVLQERRQEERKLEALQDQLKQNEEEHKQLELAVTDIYEQASGHLAALLEMEAKSGQQLIYMSTKEQQLRDQLKEQQVQHLAVQLAIELHTGMPCPVCGSAHHPAPAVAEQGQRVDEEQLQRLRELQSQWQELRLSLRQISHESRSLLEEVGGNGQYASSQEELQHLLAPAKEVSELEQVSQELEISVALNSWESDKKACQASVEQVAQQLGRLRQESQRWRQQRESVHQQSLKLQAEAHAVQAQCNELRGRQERLDQEVRKLQEIWEERCPGIPFEETEERYQLMRSRDQQADEIKERIEKSIPFIEEKTAAVQQLNLVITELDKSLLQCRLQLDNKLEQLQEKDARLRGWIGSESAEELLTMCKARLASLKAAAEQHKQLRAAADERMQAASKAAIIARQAAQSTEEQYESLTHRWNEQLEASPFAASEEIMACALSPELEKQLKEQVRLHREQIQEITSMLRQLKGKLSGKSVTQEAWEACLAELKQCQEEDELALRTKARAERDLEDVEKRHQRWLELEQKRIEGQRQAEQLAKLQSVLRGNAFVEYIAEEQLMQVSQTASQRLQYLTKQRYSLEVDSGGGFLIRDDANGGIKRPVSTLSGGETFLTSLSLALALSAQIQLRGQYPLQFFFLDEGFGTLDNELLDTVITSLERLHSDHLTVGIISHVPELRARLPRKLVISPAEQAGGGSRISLENL